MAVAVMVGGFPRKAGMERKDVMSKNVSIYKSQAAALEKHAAKDVKARHLRLILRAVGRARRCLHSKAASWCSTVLVRQRRHVFPSVTPRACAHSARVPAITHARMHDHRAAVSHRRCWSWPTRPTPTRSSCARTRPASRPRTSPRSRGWTTTAPWARRAGLCARRASCRLVGISQACVKRRRVV